MPRATGRNAFTRLQGSCIAAAATTTTSSTTTTNTTTSSITNTTTTTTAAAAATTTKYPANALEAAPRRGLLLPLLLRSLRVSVPEVRRHELGEWVRVLVGPRPRGPTVLGQQLEARHGPHGTTKTNFYSSGARAHGRPSNRKGESHLRGRRAAGVHGSGGNDQKAGGRFLAICH